MSSTASSFSILDLSEYSAGVDAWESPGILAAAEASGADKDAKKIKEKLDREEEKHTLLAESAKARLDEMVGLLGKVELTTATKDEMKRLAELDKAMERLKADLTESKSAIKSYSEEMLKSASKSKTYALMKTAKEHDIRSVIKLVHQAESVDLAFLLDCTSSMRPYIEAAKSSVKDIVRRVKRTNPDLKLRVAMIGYRDIEDGPSGFQELDFTSSVDEFETFVSKLRALARGFDYPEDIAGAVKKACALSWQQMSRVTFLITDAPCHGTKYHLYPHSADSYPGGTPGISIEEELKNLMNKGGQVGMQLHFGRINATTDKMMNVFHSLGIEFDVCDLGVPDKLTSTVASSVRKSISKSVTASKAKSKSKSTGGGLLGDETYVTKDYTIREVKPSLEDWKSFKISAVNVLCNKPISTVNDLKAPLHFGLVRWGKSSSSEAMEKRMLMSRAKDPFAEGEMRLAFYGKLGMDKASLLSGKGDKVLKTFKKSSSSASDRTKYLAQMEVSAIAAFLAEEYNKSSRHPAHCPKIKFLSVHVVEVNETGTERFCAEDQLPCAATAFTKYSNNTGYWNEDEINQSLLLFTRYSHEKTGGYLMVTDLQGVRNGNEYILTDPAILCKDNTRFGETNLGNKFIEKCMKATEAMLEEYGWDE